MRPAAEHCYDQLPVCGAFHTAIRERAGAKGVLGDRSGPGHTGMAGMDFGANGADSVARLRVALEAAPRSQGHRGAGCHDLHDNPSCAKVHNLDCFASYVTITRFEILD